MSDEDSLRRSPSGSPKRNRNSSTPSPVITTYRNKRRVLESDSDSDSGSSIELISRKKFALRVESDDDSDSSGSVVIKRFRGPAPLVSESESGSDDGFEGSSDNQWETDNSDNETPSTALKQKPQDTGLDSDSSTGQSEKCPICLLSFNTQEVGTPESCDHAFCAECIQEWSKNVNTCPIDRQEYTLILIRKNLNGKIIRRVPVQPPQPQNDGDIIEDPTFCEVCGSSDREDRMLLCDGCDLGFHLDCLTPPLQDVPLGNWFCNDCSPEDVVDPEVELYELQLLLDDAQEIGVRPMPRARRLMPRTRQSERVLSRIANNRSQTQAVSSTSTSRRRPRRRKRRSNYRIVYRVDEATGETIAVKKRRKRRLKKRKKRPAQPPKTVKKRLALQLGICAPKILPQNIPEMKTAPNVGSIHNQRYNAGIPTLHLFGNQDLDDYSMSDGDESGTGGILARRAPNRHDVAVLRRARAKNRVFINNNNTNPVSSSSDILSDILDCQTKFHSKNSKLSLSKDGKITIESQKIDLYNSSNNQNRIRQRPANYSPNNTSDNTPSSSGVSNCNQQQNSSNSVPSSTFESINITSDTYHSNLNQQQNDSPQDYTQTTLSLVSNQDDNVNKEKKSDSRSATPNSAESDVDIYSDIETVSTSKVDERSNSSPQQINTPITEEDENNDSEPDMVIDTEKPEAELESAVNEEVSSTVNTNLDVETNQRNVTTVTSTSDLGEVSENRLFDSRVKDVEDDDDDDDDSEDGCPNFSIYSKESITMAKNTDINLPDKDDTDKKEQVDGEKEEHQVEEVSSSPAIVAGNDNNINMEGESGEIIDNCTDIMNTKKKKSTSSGGGGGLYSDSEDETVVKKGIESSFGISDIANMTEDISEEERSYTPCLDERGPPIRQGLEGLDTEMISDEDKNDFDESHDMKTASDGGDALEINAKESELDFSRPEDYEEGEIVDKLKNKKKTSIENEGANKEIIKQESSNVDTKIEGDNDDDNDIKKKKDVTVASTITISNSSNNGNNKKKDERDDNKDANKKDKDINQRESKEKDSFFKKLSRSNKERNYRDKEKSRSRSRDNKQNTNKDLQSKRKREKRKEIVRYNVRAIIADKPRRLKDEFGRDIRRSLSRSRTRTPSPPSRRSRSKAPRRSVSRSRDLKKRRRRTQSRSRSRSKLKKRRMSSSRERRRNRSKELQQKKKKRRRSRSRSRSPSVVKRGKEFLGEKRRRRSRDWTPSLSRSRSPDVRHFTPSWTPPRLVESPVKPHNLTVILTNDANKANKKKEKKKKAEKKSKDTEKLKKKKQQQQRIERTPPPSKEVFASGDNILVSVSFNKENETRDVSTKKKRDTSEEKSKKASKEKQRVKNRIRKQPAKDLSGVKPVAIIDLERSPFKELTPSPKDVIVLSDSDNDDSRIKDIDKNMPCDSSQQVASPEQLGSNNYTGPKTPPEPQVKFTLTSKAPQLRAISNPLHEPEEPETNDEDSHKGPNTPPEPPNSPPSSPDAYDPFEPTKSRSPTPEIASNQAQSQALSVSSNNDINNIETIINDNVDIIDKSNVALTPEALKSHTPPPLADVQPADSQSCIQATQESLNNSNKSPDRSTALNNNNNNQSVQTQTITAKPIAQTIPFSSPIPITSTPVTNLAPPRISILNTTIITPSSLPQRIVLPNTTKSSPVKISPTKSTTIKATPIKPMRKSSTNNNNNNNNNQNGSGDAGVESLSLDSPYSPGSSDYEDLFEPPTENLTKPTAVQTKAVVNKTTAKSPTKIQNAFDALFGSPFNKIKPKSGDSKGVKYNSASSNVKKLPLPPIGKGSKQVGVKVDEDSLKILDELPNSAVEMQVKDKFLKKLNRQERVVEEVKLVLKPHYNKKHINKEEYKDILRRAVPKICHNKSGEINPTKIKNLIEAYVKKVRHSKKVTSSSSVNPQKA